MKWTVLVVSIAACGGAAPAAKPTQAAATAEPAPEATCSRLATLHREHCGAFADMELDEAACPDIMRRARKMEPNSARLALLELGRCAMSTPVCNEALECAVQIEYFHVPVEGPVPTAEAVCKRAHGALRTCNLSFGDSEQACVTAMADEAGFLKQFGHCLVDKGDACGAVTACMQDSVFNKNDLRACSEVDTSKGVGLLRADWARRKGANVTRYSQAHSTKAQPVEVCGLRAENEWLFAATCDNGSHPIVNRDQAEKARTGNEGGGGRCGSIIDRYQVKCPETTYDIHIDAYVCPLAK